MRAHRVLVDYQVPRLNGKDGVVWTEGTVVVLHDDDAAWVNRDRPGTLEAEAPEDGDGAGESATAKDSQTSAAADKPAEVPATAPAAEQVGGKPPRGSGRRRDSGG